MPRVRRMISAVQLFELVDNNLFMFYVVLIVQYFPAGNSDILVFQAQLNQKSHHVFKGTGLHKAGRQ